MTNRFKSTFDYCDRIEAEINGFTVTARVDRDDCMGEPWKEHDGHGPVSDWTSRDKAPGERVLVSDRHSKRYYDYAGAIKIAKRDGWDAPPYGEGTSGEQAARAVEADFKHLSDWCNDEWYWCSVILSVSKNGVTLDEYAASLGGIESTDRSYLTEVANELLDEAVVQGKSILSQLCSR